MAIQKLELNMSGTKGLAPQFFGDKPYTSSSPHLRYLGDDGQIAEGIFNPFSSIGYMSPANNSFDPLTGTITQAIISRVYSPSQDTLYLFENGTKVATLSGLDDTSVTETTLLSQSSVFKDSELYEVHDYEAIFYTYLNNTPTLSNVPNLNLGFFTTDSSKGAFQLASTVYESLDITDVSYDDIVSGGSQKLAQKFSTTDFSSSIVTDVTGIRLRMKTIFGTPQLWTLKVGIQTDVAGKPSGSYVANASTTIAAASLPMGDYDYVYFTFPALVTLTTSTPYHIVIEPTVWGEIGAEEGVHVVKTDIFDSLYERGQTELYDGTTWTQTANGYYSYDFALILNQYNYVGFQRQVQTYLVPAIDSTSASTVNFNTNFIASNVDDSSGASSLTITKPTGTVQNDIMFALISSNVSYPNAAPSGWTLLGQSQPSTFWSLYYKVAGGSEPANYQWGFAGSQKVRGTIATYRGGFNTSSPIMTSSNTIYTTNNTTLRAASITTSAYAPLLVIGGVFDTSATRTFTPVASPTAMQEDIDAGNASSDFWHTFDRSPKWLNAAATGVMDIIISNTETDKHAFAVALNPVASLSYTHTTISANNPLLVVGVRCANEGTSTVTCDGIPMTQLETRQTSTVNIGRMSMYYTVGLAAGAHTIAVTPATETGVVQAMASGYTGVEQMDTVAFSDTDVENEAPPEDPDFSFPITRNYQLPVVFAGQDQTAYSILFSGAATRGYDAAYDFIKMGDAVFADGNFALTSLSPYVVSFSDSNGSGDNEDYLILGAVFNNAAVSSGGDTIPAIVQADTTDILHSSQNGLLYWLTGNRVHAYDGFRTGGNFGTFNPDVLIFPSYTKIVDVTETNSLMYIAIENSATSNPDYRMFNADVVGVYCWDKKSTVEGIRNFYAVPNARSIKKVFTTGSGDVYLITTGSNRLTEVRTLVNGKFQVKYTLGLNSYPNKRDSLSYLDDMAVWLGRDGYVYALGKVTPDSTEELFRIGDMTGWPTGAYTTGTLIIGALADSGTQSSIDKAIISYNDTIGNKLVRWIPNGTGTINSVVQLGHIGNVYSLVKYLPDMSTVKYVDIRCAPTATGSETIATIKYYFNGQTTPSITKTVTKTDASKGYVRHEINKPFINAIQVKVEYSTANTLGSTNDFKPSIALANYEDSPALG